MLRVSGRGRTGLLLIRDRKPDGSYVVLECEEVEPGGGGVVGDPDDDEVFPTASVLERVAAHAVLSDAEPFRLELDITDMPPGELRFRSHVFVEQAIEHSSAGFTRIDQQSAEGWGFSAPATAGR